MQSLILDFLCLDQAKSLVKVPLCALNQLEISPNALDEVMATSYDNRTDNELQQSARKGEFRLQLPSSDDCNETTTT